MIATAPAAEAVTPQPIAVDAVSAANLLGVARSTWLELVRSGRAPAGAKLGRCRRWCVAELRDWLAAGAPPRHRWTWRPEGRP